MRQTLPIVLIVIAAVLVVGVKVVAPKPGSLRSDFTAVKTAVPNGMKSFPMSCCHGDVRSWCDIIRTCSKVVCALQFIPRCLRALPLGNI